MKKYSFPNLPLKFKFASLRTPKGNRRMVHSGPAPRCFCICFRADSAANLVLCYAKKLSVHFIYRLPSLQKARRGMLLDERV